MSNEKRHSSQLESNDDEDCDMTEENIINILVASDINLGYERTVNRNQDDDSFRTFEEILKYARDYDVDFILFGGNLFYESNPPIGVIMKCISLLRKYCLSQKAVKIDCITDPDWVFNHCDHKIVNFKDPNLNIGLPIFSIYGHRDTPIFSSIGALDLLATTGLINYFGKFANNSEVSIPPLLFRKGLTSLALYGLNHMNDKKLSKLMRNNKFELLQDDCIPDLCNVLILHQKRKRPNRAENTYISESLLPDFLNLVIWGHEPVCRIKHKPVPEKSVRISQPGSCIATSLTRGESRAKQVAVLQVYKDSFRMKYLRLKTVRPFAFERLVLSEFEEEISELQAERVSGWPAGRSRAQAVEALVDNYLRDVMLPKARKQESGDPRQPLKPLLRLKVVHDTASDRFDLRRLSKKYRDKVANPEEIVSFFDRFLHEDINNDDDDNEDYEGLSDILFEDGKQNWMRTVEGGISEYFSHHENRKKMKVVSVNNLNKALAEFKQDDGSAFERRTKKEIEKVINRLTNEDVDVEDALEAVENYRN